MHSQCPQFGHEGGNERDVPTYIIFSNAALREMARAYPATPSEFGGIPGVGAHKLEDFGEAFVEEVTIHPSHYPRQRFD